MARRPAARPGKLGRRPTCLVCGAVPLGSYLTDWRDGAVCSRHTGSPPCHWCGAFAAGRGATRTPDSLDLCGICASTAVDSPEKTTPVLEDVERELRVRYQVLLPRPVQVRLATLPTFVAEAGGESFCGSTRTMATIHPDGSVERDVIDILMMWQMPATRFGAVLAHEFGHAWMAFKGFPHNLEPMVEEGIAQLISDLYLEHKSDPESAHIRREYRESPDPVYGEGFRQLQAAVKANGLLETLRHVKTHSALPLEKPRALPPSQ